jgi:hypothetical protein
VGEAGTPTWPFEDMGRATRLDAFESPVVFNRELDVTLHVVK